LLLGRYTSTRAVEDLNVHRVGADVSQPDLFGRRPREV
jgi:hypothetical protein